MAPEPDLLFPPFRLDLEQQYLWRETARVPLRPKAFAVLHYLAAHAPHLVTPADLLQAVWAEAYVSEGLLRSYMRELRAVLGDTAKAPQFIETVLRRGWRFLAPVTTSSTVAAVQTRALATVPVPASAPEPRPAAATSTPVAPALSRIRHIVPGEHKQVTVLVAGLHGVPALAQAVATEGLYELLSRAATLMREAVERFEGTVTQCSGDRLLALFGAPIAQEDHVVRALQAALEGQRAFAAYADELWRTRAVALELAVGVHAGPVVLGPRRPDGHPDTTAYGVTVCLAERVQGLAAGGAIAVSAAVWQQAMNFFHFEDLGAWTVPESAPPVRLYACTGVAQGASRLEAFLHRHRSPFVGRERDLERLGSLWARVRQGQGQVVVLFGEAGIGKSRLADEFQRILTTGRTLHAHTLSYGQAMPYHALLPLLRAVVGLTDHDTPQHQRQALRACLAAAQPPLSADEPLLAHLLGVPLEPDHLPPLPPDEQKRRLQHACLQVVLQHAAEQPLCLLIEDLHWLDPSSQALLDLVVTALAGQPVLVLGTARPGFRDLWTAHTYYHRLTLAPLSADLTATFVRQYVQPYEAAPALTALLHARTAGNPFFLEEMLRTMQDQRLMVVQDGVYVLHQAAHLAMPASIQGMLAARIDQLSAEAKHLLQTAAVIGREVPWSLLTSMADLPDEALHRGLAHLQNAELLYETRVVPLRTYTFQHALTHEAAYQSLLQSTRQHYHQRIAEVLEAQFPETVATQPELVAQHYTTAGCHEQALLYWLRAGQRASERSANVEAIAALEQALEALQHLPENRTVCVRAIDLRLDLCVALWRLGDWRGALDRLREAEALAERVGDQRRLAHVSSEMADALRILGDNQRALLAGQRALTLALALGDTALQVDANTQLGLIYYSRGDYGRATEALRQTVTARARDGRPDAPAVWSWSWLLVCLSQGGAFAEGQAMSADVLRLAEATAHPFDLVVATFGVGRLSLRQGDLSQAIAVFERGLALCHTHDLRDWIPTLAASVGYAYALAGRLSEALTLLEHAVGQYAVMRVGAPDPTSVVWLGEAYLRAGRLDEACTQTQCALEFSRAHQERGNEAYAMCLLGDIAARRAPPETAPAEAHYQQALALAGGLSMRPLVAHCHRGLGTLYAATGQRERARIALSTAIAMYRTMDMTFWLPQAEAALAQVERS